MGSVHGAVDHAGPIHRGPAAIAACLSSSELGLRLLRWPRLPNEGWRREKGARGSRFWAHRGSEGGGVSVVKAAVGELWCGSLGAQKLGKRSGGGAVGGGDAGALFYRVEGGAGRPGIKGEWAAVAMRHNCGGGGRFGRGSAGVMVGSDERGEGCSGRFGRRGAGRQRWLSVWGGR
jgi:hypothetical protein